MSLRRERLGFQVELLRLDRPARLNAFDTGLLGAFLAPLVGVARAKDLILTGRRLEAQEALRCGFVRSVHPAGEAEAAALEVAAGIPANPAEGVRGLKALFRKLGGGAGRTALENSMLPKFQRQRAGLPRR